MGCNLRALVILSPDAGVIMNSTPTHTHWRHPTPRALARQLQAPTLRSRVLPPMRVREQARVGRTRGQMRMESVPLAHVARGQNKFVLSREKPALPSLTQVSEIGLEFSRIQSHTPSLVLLNPDMTHIS